MAQSGASLALMGLLVAVFPKVCITRGAVPPPPPLPPPQKDKEYRLNYFVSKHACLRVLYTYERDDPLLVNSMGPSCPLGGEGVLHDLR